MSVVQPARIGTRAVEASLFGLVSWIVCGALAGCDEQRYRPDPGTHVPRRVLEADRAAAERDDQTPVNRLFVNGDALEVEDLLRPLRADLTQAAATMPAASYQRLLRERILTEFRDQIRSLLLYQEATRRMSEREEEFVGKFVDDEIRNRVNTEYGGRQSNYEKALEEAGLTLAEARQRIRRDMLIMRHLQQTVTARVLDPTRDELVRFFNEHRHEMTRPERRRMSLIEISTESPDARKRVAQARAMLLDGADFASVASEYSEGLHAESGGAWDWLSRGSMREHWEPAVEALFRLPEAGLSEIIEADGAFFIVRCDAIEPAVEPDFEAMQPQLIRAVRDREFNRLVSERVQGLQQEAVFVPANVGRFLQAVAEAAPPPADS
jgi:parvulin-like peptidyl-prolyl isomerase